MASMHGWLVMRDIISEEGRCFLWNPDTGETIYLPALDNNYKHLIDERLYWCILVSPPTNPDCMVLFAVKGVFLSWQIGDGKWTKQDYEFEEYGPLYLVTSSAYGKLYTYSISNLEYGGRGIVVVDRDSCGTLSIRSLDIGASDFRTRSEQSALHLVESFGDIYRLEIGMVGRKANQIVDTVIVFKMDALNKVWVKMEDLCDRVFFISSIGSITFYAADLGLKGNCIYFTLEDDTFHIFDLEDESLSEIWPCPELSEPFFKPFWLMPSNRRFETHKKHNITTTEKKLQMETLSRKRDIIETSNITITNKKLKMELSRKHKIMETSNENTLIDLSKDILCLIAMHLPLAVDFMSFRCVCATLAASVPRLTFQCTSGQYPFQYPWLMFSGARRSQCSFIDPVCNIIHDFDMPELSGAQIWFSKDGWLLIGKGRHSMFFLNPFTKEIVELPDLPGNVFLQTASFSSAPNSSGCIVLGIDSDVGSKTTTSTCFLRLGENEWTTNTYDNEIHLQNSLSNPVFYDGSFYCLGHKKNLGVFDVSDGRSDWSVHPVLPPCPSQIAQESYLLEHDGELLSVFIGYKGQYVNVYKLDRSNMKWDIMSDLQGRMLFLSRSTSMALKAVAERMQNRICFPMWFQNKTNYLFYSLETRSWQSNFNNFCDEQVFNAAELLHCTWIQPTFTCKPRFS